MIHNLVLLFVFMIYFPSALLASVAVSVAPALFLESVALTASLGNRLARACFVDVHRDTRRCRSPSLQGHRARGRIHEALQRRERVEPGWHVGSDAVVAEKVSSAILSPCNGTVGCMNSSSGDPVVAVKVTIVVPPGRLA